MSETNDVQLVFISNALVALAAVGLQKNAHLEKKLSAGKKRREMVTTEISKYPYIDES